MPKIGLVTQSNVKALKKATVLSLKLLDRLAIQRLLYRAIKRAQDLFSDIVQCFLTVSFLLLPVLFFWRAKDRDFLIHKWFLFFYLVRAQKWNFLEVFLQRNRTLLHLIGFFFFRIIWLIFFEIIWLLSFGNFLFQFKLRFMTAFFLDGINKSVSSLKFL